MVLSYAQRVMSDLSHPLIRLLVVLFAALVLLLMLQGLRVALYVLQVSTNPTVIRVRVLVAWLVAIQIKPVRLFVHFVAPGLTLTQQDRLDVLVVP